MNARSIILLCIALVVGTSLAVATRRILNAIPENQDAAREVKMVPVMVAKQDIHFGDELTPQNIRFDRFPDEKIPGEVITNYSDAKHRFAKKDLVKGDLISVYDLNDIEKEASSGGNYTPVNNGRISFIIDSVLRNGEVVRNGIFLNEIRSSIHLDSDRVDFVLTFEKKDETGTQRTSAEKTILSGVEISSAKVLQEQIGSEEITKNSLELSFVLEKEKIAELEKAHKLGKITIVLHPSQGQMTESDGVVLNPVLFGSNSALPAEEAVSEKSDSTAESNLALNSAFSGLSSSVPAKETSSDESGDTVESGSELNPIFFNSGSSEIESGAELEEKKEEAASADAPPLGVSVPRASDGEPAVTSASRPLISIPRPESAL